LYEKYPGEEVCGPVLSQDTQNWYKEKAKTEEINRRSKRVYSTLFAQWEARRDI